jgi:molybdopterin/thiamine biosynthesis adenylyltransferase
LAHLGLGRIVVIDDEVVEDVNLGRMIGSQPADANKALKTEVMARVIEGIDPSIVVEQVPHRFPARETLEPLKTVDIVIACVDSFVAREEINTFCRRYDIPLIDIGLGIETKEGRLISAYGQLTVAMPSSACLRCSPLLSDAVLEKERLERPPGYDRNAYAVGDPQIVSMNGVLASEAVNMALDLITGYANGKRDSNWWLYDGRAGTMTKCDPFGRRVDCPACAEQGHGDPRFR